MKQLLQIFYASVSIAMISPFFSTAKAQNECNPEHTSGYFYTSNFATTSSSTEYVATAQSSSGTLQGYNDLSNDASYNITQVAGGQINFSHTYSGDYGHTVRIWVDWNNDETFDNATEEVFLGKVTNGTATLNGTFTIPMTTTPSYYRLRIRSGYSTMEACSSMGSGQTIDFTLVVTPLTPCEGKIISAGTVHLSTPEANAGANFSVSASNFSVHSGLQFTWEKLYDTETTWQQVSTSSNTYSPLNNEIAPNNAGTSVKYRLKVSCGTNEPMISDTATFTTIKQYCTPAYSNAGDYIASFTTTGALKDLNYSSTQQISSGTAKGYNDLTQNEDYTIKQVVGQTLNFSHVYGGSVPSITLRIWIDWNDNGTFEDDNFENVFTENNANGYNHQGQITVPENIIPGTYRMRIRAKWNSSLPTPCSQESNGQVIDVNFVVTELSECSGQPSTGSITVTPDQANQGTNYHVTASGYPIYSGLLFEWQHTTDGTTWHTSETPTAFYVPLNNQIAPELGTTIQHRLKVTCTQSNQVVYSDVKTFTTHKIYCQPIFSKELYEPYIKTITTTGAYQNLNNADTGYGTNGSGYSDYTDQQLKTNTNTQIEFSVITGGESEYLSIWIDTSDNGTFEPNERFFASTTRANIHTPSISLNGIQVGTYRMRVMSHYLPTDNPCVNAQSGEAEDYTLMILPCNIEVGTISADNYTLCQGQTTQVNATVENGTWESEDNTIASIESNGKVVAHSQGTVKIHYIVSNEFCSDTASQNFTVVEPYTHATLDGNVVVKVGEPSSFVGTPAGGTWSSNDPEIADFENPNEGVLIAKKEGTVNITYTVESPSPCTNTISQEKHILISQENNSSVHDFDFISDITLSPNPTSDQVNIYFSLQQASDISIEIIDLNGEILHATAFKNATIGTNTTTLNLETYAKGIYLLVLRSAKGQTTKKIVIE